MSTNNTTGPIIKVGNTQYLDRKDFDFKKREAIRDNLFWKAFNLGVYLLFLLIIAGYCSYYINEYLEKKNYENWIYYILIIFLAISIFTIMLIIVLFLIIPYSKLRGVMLLVKSMSNIYGADYADPDIHNSMGTILGNDEDDGKQISNFLLTSHGNVPSQIIRSLNPEAYTGVDTRQIGIPVPASTVEDANGQQREVSVQKVTKPVPALRPLTKINVSTENSSPAESIRFENPVFDPSVSQEALSEQQKLENYKQNQQQNNTEEFNNLKTTVYEKYTKLRQLALNPENPGVINNLTADPKQKEYLKNFSATSQQKELWNETATRALEIYKNATTIQQLQEAETILDNY